MSEVGLEALEAVLAEVHELNPDQDGLTELIIETHVPAFIKALEELAEVRDLQFEPGPNFEEGVRDFLQGGVVFGWFHALGLPLKGGKQHLIMVKGNTLNSNFGIVGRLDLLNKENTDK